MGFLRIVEVFPPTFPVSSKENGSVALEEKTESFIEGVRSIRDLADIFLVASLKNPESLRLSSIEAARLLQDRLRVDAAPVVIVRDTNRLQFLSMVLTAVSLDFAAMMIAWGDNYPDSARTTNVRDFSDLGEAIREANTVRRRARGSMKYFAPVDLQLRKREALGKSRLVAGADYLLAQPPSFDSDTLDQQSSKLERLGIRNKVIPNVFPFKDAKDLEYCEKYFGWRFPKHFRNVATKGGSALLKEERNVVRRLRDEGFPGVYVSTRGHPPLARSLLS
jgi:5,10-methylenetetrahydrofolate reductase